MDAGCFYRHVCPHCGTYYDALPMLACVTCGSTKLAVTFDSDKRAERGEHITHAAAKQELDDETVPPSYEDIVELEVRDRFLAGLSLYTSQMSPESGKTKGVPR